MAKTVMLAVAGAGKTYKLCNSIDPFKKNLLIAFTNQNIKNLRNELINKFGNIPEKTRIMTFHSFLYKLYILPYEPSILSFFKKNKFKNKGITFKEPPKQWLGKRGSNSNYDKDICFNHYIYNKKYYCSKMSKLVIKSKIVKKATLKLNDFFDYLYIDEFQDFREHDYRFLKEVIKNINNILLVGDYYQHSVSGKNNSGIPFKKGKKEVSYAEYEGELRKLKLEIDKKTLSKSRICHDSICDFVSKKLEIDINANNTNEGKIIVLEDKKEIKKVIENNSIKKLVWNKSHKYNFNSINWGYSKGDTYEKTCVILTDRFKKIVDKDLKIIDIKMPNSSRNKLYVALTRTKGDLYIIRKKDFDTYNNFKN
jgi:DNA helicase-2/ATP-dependent DNA helicase PcrA